MSRQAPKDEGELAARVDEIREGADDNEGAHSEEDLLYTQVLSLIADGKCPDPAKWAALVLTTGEIEFERWCA